MNGWRQSGYWTMLSSTGWWMNWTPNFIHMYTIVRIATQFCRYPLLHLSCTQSYSIYLFSNSNIDCSFWFIQGTMFIFARHDSRVKYIQHWKLDFGIDTVTSDGLPGAGGISQTHCAWVCYSFWYNCPKRTVSVREVIQQLLTREITVFETVYLYLFQRHCPVMVPIWLVCLCLETAVDHSGGWYTWQPQHPVDSITCQHPYSQLMHVSFRNAFLLYWLNNITSVFVTVQPLQWPIKCQLRSDEKRVGICLFKYFPLLCFRDTIGSGPTFF